ncbi:hypothetical protein [Tropicimonas sp. IMCC6043]|uniref:hypothetical protein n=1 Tax=Tropicimonas sp. IMCC6043 TaxID=2510645 RepID=UPI0013EC1ACC|nr:hypothetical protein [Tropicimonas sp. IMCC6043]
MTSLSLSPAGMFSRFLLLRRRPGVMPRHKPALATPQEEERQRREVVQDMLENRPEFFSSHLDVETAMQFFPERI